MSPLIPGNICLRRRNYDLGERFWKRSQAENVGGDMYKRILEYYLPTLNHFYKNLTLFFYLNCYFLMKAIQKFLHRCCETNNLVRKYNFLSWYHAFISKDIVNHRISISEGIFYPCTERLIFFSLFMYASSYFTYSLYLFFLFVTA